MLKSIFQVQRLFIYNYLWSPSLHSNRNKKRMYTDISFILSIASLLLIYIVDFSLQLPFILLSFSFAFIILHIEKSKVLFSIVPIKQKALVLNCILVYPIFMAIAGTLILLFLILNTISSFFYSLFDKTVISSTAIDFSQILNLISSLLASGFICFTLYIIYLFIYFFLNSIAKILATASCSVGIYLIIYYLNKEIPFTFKQEVENQSIIERLFRLYGYLPVLSILFIGASLIASILIYFLIKKKSLFS